MPTPSPYNFSTGPTQLPDIGRLWYNGVTFGPYFVSNVSGTVIRDNAGRTTKFLEMTLTVDGYVMAADISGVKTASISPAMVNLFSQLTTTCGDLVYSGRGFDIYISKTNATIAGSNLGKPMCDLAWGPMPELMEFQPLGGGFSAKVVWRVKFRVANESGFTTQRFGGPILQFNTDTTVTYGEDCFSTLAIKGTLEIPMTRITGNRTSTNTADAYRAQVERRIMAGIDLGRFRVTKRNFFVTRDKRTLEWDFQMEEKPYMDNPPGCTVARGSYSVRPAKAGMGLVLWLCSLRCTYTVRADFPRRTAWDVFLALLRLRMLESAKGNIAGVTGGDQNPTTAPPSNAGANLGGAGGAAVGGAGAGVAGAAAGYLVGRFVGSYLQSTLQNQNQAAAITRRAFLIDFGYDEGLYQDSKNITFHASWRLITTFSHILIASGIWNKVPEKNGRNESLWGIAMKDIQGWQSWLPNVLDPKLDVIVDFGFS
jgi:hypothetical protein